MSNDLEKGMNMQPYRHYGETIEETHNQVKFTMKSALRYVIDNNDSSSNEKFDYEDLDYYRVVNYDMLSSSDVLDLTWMNKDDIFDLEDNEQNKFIKEIRVNIDNLAYSHLPINTFMFNDLKLTINGADANDNTIQRIKGFKSFIEEHTDCIKSIKLEEFSPIVETVLGICAKSSGIEVSTENQEIRHK